MNPKQKAKKIFKKFQTSKDENGWNICEFDSCAKKCALILVDEIINERFDFRKIANVYNNERIKFWSDVKLEIEKL